jgi:hypothetical protein
MPVISKKLAGKPALKKTTISATLTKYKNAATLSDQQGVLEGYESLVDQLSALEAVITPEVLTALRKQKRLEEELRTIADKEVPADARAVLTGTLHDFTVSERAEKREVIVQQARLALGEKLFGEVARVLLGDLDKYLTKDQQGACVTVSRTGPRKGVLVAKGG